MHKHTSLLALLGWSTHPVASYSLGLLDESTLVEVTMQSEYGPDFGLLVPGFADFPMHLSEQTAFHDGAGAGYYLGEHLGETPLQVANTIYRIFSDDFEIGDAFTWIVGYLLGCLAVLAQQDRQLALVGMAHLCFLISCISEPSSFLLSHALGLADILHREVLQAYRAQVQVLKAQGFCLEEAWWAALSASH